MRRENDRVRLAERSDEVPDLDYLLRVKTDGRLVEDYNARVADERLRDADSLLIAL